MKNNTALRVGALLLLLSLTLLTLFSCKEEPATGLWADAAYTEDQTFGEGAKTLTVVVEAEDRTVTFTVHTDAATVGEALLSHGLIDGDEGPYGLYVKKVNGMTADYDVDQSYWSFLIGEETAMTGVDMTEITEGTEYRLVYTK